ncbi:acyl carrier protein [Paenibacillus sambharensis]|uniref:Acyl carrier protein n=1 Tax=Paenibacillus sambharensis TaxID=1803190 RepID=A0A2W1LB14_9BACL|nr:acyl carrier protein [Paenibacillus sambharensis]PZD95320.1 acyl carrier protein [Paenibacillus sambharensis]
MKQDMNKFSARLIELVNQLTGEEWELSCLDRPLEELGVDSLMALELAVHLEREFGIRLEEEELASLTRLSDIVAKAEGKYSQ